MSLRQSSEGTAATLRVCDCENIMQMATLIGFFCVLLAATLAQAQRQTGFISIDCGSPSKFQYQDMDTGISYVSDEAYITTGINRNISSQYAYPINPNLPLPLSDLRSFPQGFKNCYSLNPSAGNGSLNLIRASFLYGNYDGLNRLPEFDIYVDVNLWFTVTFQSASHIVTTEIITTALSDIIHVCLVDKGLGVPFISVLELRPLNASIYATEFGRTSASLLLFRRLDIGQTNGTGRYQEDIYDRIWTSYFSTAWDPLATSQAIHTFENGYRVPYDVIRTAAKPQNGTASLELNWNANDSNSEFYVYLYFAEVEQLGRNQTRKFNVSWNGTPLFGSFSPPRNYSTILSNSKALVGKEHLISIYRAEDSTHPPILNAVEIFMIKHMGDLPTYSQDVDAIVDVKTTYQINKNWTGDPCGPKNFIWEGLKCSYNASFPRIISLNLSSSNLSGTLAASIAKLSLLESLDLSNNNLSGSIPLFLEDLKSLKFMNLKDNHLSGLVPSALLERSDAGLLVLSVDGQNLCGSDSCKKKRQIVVPIVASLSSAVAVLIALTVIWKLRKERKSKADMTKKMGKTVAIKKIQLSHEEVLEITSNFGKVIGKGGFGTVYHGYMKDGNQVAVKMLSPSSSQGPREFQTEAELLMRIHHRNLVCFVGYCDDADHLALIYEYMANGSLKEYLSEKSSDLSWEMRLRIAIDAAQGLEYLHHGCKPPIVHRDVKTANILLTENLDAKIADFGLSKAFPSDRDSHVETKVVGTTGYLDPEYYTSRKLNEKSDVYSFGVVLLELITGQTAVIKSGDRMHILDWVVTELEKGDITRIVDGRMMQLQPDLQVKSVKKALQLAMACTTFTSLQRPTMGSVLADLKLCLEMELCGDSISHPQTTTSTDTSHHHQDRIYITSSSYFSSDHELYSNNTTHSLNAQSMTAPFPR